MPTPPTPLQPTSQPRPGCWFFTLPIGLVAVIIGAYGVLFLMGARGRPADGDTLRLHYASCEEALPIVQGRVDIMGLGDPSFETVPDGFVLTARLPSEPERAARIPVALALPGDFAIVDASTGDVVVDRSHLAASQVRLDVVANPSAVVHLDEEGAKALAVFRRDHPTGSVAAVIDGERVWEHKNEHPLDTNRLDLPTTKTTLLEGTSQSAEWALLLDSPPLPCEVRLVSSETVQVEELP